MRRRVKVFNPASGVRHDTRAVDLRTVRNDGNPVRDFVAVYLILVACVAAIFTIAALIVKHG